MHGLIEEHAGSHDEYPQAIRRSSYPLARATVVARTSATDLKPLTGLPKLESLSATWDQMTLCSGRVRTRPER
jgi:hypothetical protein